MNSRRGQLLLELLLSVAIFVAAAITISSIVRRAQDSLRQTRDQHVAADLAQSALARIESGLATPESLNGPVPDWPSDDPDAPTGFDDAPPTGAWRIEIATEASAFPGLTRVSVTARRDDPTLPPASFTMHQLVRLGQNAVDTVGRDAAGRSR